MAISIKCGKCSSTVRIDTKKCPKCGSNVSRRWVYRVWVQVGTKWRTKQVSTLSMAKKVEARYKADAMTEGELGLVKAPFIDEAWKLLNTHNQGTIKPEASTDIRGGFSFNHPTHPYKFLLCRSQDNALKHKFFR